MAFGSGDGVWAIHGLHQPAKGGRMSTLPARGNRMRAFLRFLAWCFGLLLVSVPFSWLRRYIEGRYHGSPLHTLFGLLIFWGFGGGVIALLDWTGRRRREEVELEKKAEAKKEEDGGSRR